MRFRFDFAIADSGLSHNSAPPFRNTSLLFVKAHHVVHIASTRFYSH